MKWFMIYISGGRFDGEYALVEAINEADARIEFSERLEISDYDELEVIEPMFVFSDRGDV